MKIRCESVKERLIESEKELQSRNELALLLCILKNQKTILSMLSGSYSEKAFDFDSEAKDTFWKNRWRELED